MSLSELNEVYMELESLIRDFSETLIAELALRDELDYDKELKNAFISLLLAVQNRRFVIINIYMIYLICFSAIGGPADIKSILKKIKTLLARVSSISDSKILNFHLRFSNMTSSENRRWALLHY